MNSLSSAVLNFERSNYRAPYTRTCLGCRKNKNYRQKLCLEYHVFCHRTHDTRAVFDRSVDHEAENSAYHRWTPQEAGPRNTSGSWTHEHLALNTVWWRKSEARLNLTFMVTGTLSPTVIRVLVDGFISTHNFLTEDLIRRWLWTCKGVS